VVYIVGIGSIGAFMFWMVHKHEPDRNAAVVLKLLILGAGFVAIFASIIVVDKNLKDPS
jgi:hypothetical protein